MRKWQITLIVTIALAVLGMAGAGWSQRPIIDYDIARLENTHDASYYPMEIALRIRNRGDVDASLYLIAKVTNANITVDNPEPWIELNQTQVRFKVSVMSNMENYGEYVIKIRPVENAQNFTISYTIEDRSNPVSINGMISHLFLEPHGYSPTYAFYNKTDSNNYQWLK